MAPPPKPPGLPDSLKDGSSNFSGDELLQMTDGIADTQDNSNRNRDALQRTLSDGKAHGVDSTEEHGRVVGRTGQRVGGGNYLRPDRFKVSQHFNNKYKDPYKVPGDAADPAYYNSDPPARDPNPSSIEEMYNKFNGARVPDDVHIWQTIGTRLGTAGNELSTWLSTAQRYADSKDGNGWGGQAGDAVRGYLGQFKGLTKSLEICAKNMRCAYQAYRDSVNIREDVCKSYKLYVQVLNGYYTQYENNAITADEYNLRKGWLDDDYRKVVETLMNAYHERIVEAAKYPAVDKVAPPEAPAQVAGPGPGPGPGPGGGGVPKVPATPDLSKLLNNKNIANTPQKDNPASSIQPLTDAAQKGMEGLSDAASKASDAGQGALQAGLDGVKQLADSLTNGNPAGLNEGALNLGPGGLAGLGKLGGGPTGTGKAGGGGGAGTRAPVMPKTGVQMAEATKAATGTPSASRAGLAAGAGSAGAPGAGAPAAGRGAGGGGDKEHKASKALRSKTNGEAVAGVTDAAAVIPVVGGESEATPPAETAKR